MPEKRKNHYVAQFQLAFFTSNGERDGDFYVFDLERKIVRKSTPHNEAHKANLYTPDAKALAGAADPAAAQTQFEDFLAGMETNVAPVIKRVVETGRLPADDKDRAWILYFVAMNIFRTPEFLQQADANAMQIAQQFALFTLRSNEMWKQYQARRAAGGHPVDDAGRAKLIGLFQKHPRAVTLNKGSILGVIPEAIQLAIPVLEKRRWRVERVPQGGGDLVLPNCPVTLTQRSNVVPMNIRGLLAEDTLMLLPLSPGILLVSIYSRREVGRPTAGAAHANTCALNSLEQRGAVPHKSACVFARKPDFPIVAADGTIRTFRAAFPEFKLVGA